MSNKEPASAPPSLTGITAPLVINVVAPAAGNPVVPVGAYRPHMTSHEAISPVVAGNTSCVSMLHPYQPLTLAQGNSTPTKQTGQPPLDAHKPSSSSQTTPSAPGSQTGNPVLGWPSATPPSSPCPTHAEKYNPLAAPSPTKIPCHLPHVASAPTAAAIVAPIAALPLIYDPLRGRASVPTCGNANAGRSASTDGTPLLRHTSSAQAHAIGCPPPLQHFPTAPTSPAPDAISTADGSGAVLAPAAAEPTPAVAVTPAEGRPTEPPVNSAVPQPPRTAVVVPRSLPVVGSRAPPLPPRLEAAIAAPSVRAVTEAAAAAAAAHQPAPQPAQAAAAAGHPAQLREQAMILHELVGGKFDILTCEDVLTQVEGDLNRAALIMLDDYGGGSRGGPDIDAAAAAAAAGLGPHEAAVTCTVDSMAPTTKTMSYVNGAGSGSIVPGAGRSTNRALAFVAAVFDGDVPQPACREPLNSHTHSHPHRKSVIPAEHLHDTGGAGAGGCADLPPAAVVPAVGGSVTDSNIGGPSAWDGGADADPSVSEFFWGIPGPDPAVLSGCSATALGDVITSGGFGVAAEGIFAPNAPEPATPWPAAAAGPLESGGVLASANSPYSSSQDAAAEADDGWIPMTELQGDLLEEHLEEMRIYFPHLDDSMLRTTLEAHNGNLQLALQMMSELYEEEIYHKIDMDRQAESDAALARKLAEQQLLGSSPVAAVEHPLGPASDSVAEDYVLNAIEDVEPQVSSMLAAKRRARDSSAGAGLRSSRERWGLKLLVHIFGPQVDEGLMEAVLATHNGDVEAARATLRGMDLTECQQPQTQTQPQPQQGLLSATAAGQTDPWATPAATAIAWDDLMVGADASAPLVSHRAGQAGAAATSGGRSGVGGCGSSNLAATLRAEGGSGDGGSCRRSGTAHVPLLAPMQGEAAPNVGALGAVSCRVLGQAATPPTGRTAAVAAASTSSASASTPPIIAGGGGGPIRWLSRIGINCMDKGYLDDTMTCIRVAFDKAAVLEPLLQHLENQEQGDPDGRRLALGRPGGGLTHEEKQALWGKHRELPLALKSMRDKLRLGAQATYESGGPGSKRLARELRDAANLVDAAIREQHRKASDRIYAGINAALQQEWKTDLHALLPEEVLEKLEDQLQKLCFLKGNVYWIIITGKGLHSRGDGPKLPAMVDEWLACRGLVGHRSPGTVTVHLTPELCEQLMASGPQHQQQPQQLGPGMSGSGVGPERGLANLSLGSFGT